MIIKADLHNHTCLSPCGALEMSPSLIAKTAKEKGIDLIAIADHNSALNCPAFFDACKRENIWAMFGLEITSMEEAHLVCIFEAPDAALDFGQFIYDNLPDMPNNPDIFGDQIYVDGDDNIEGEVERYLGNATLLSIDDIRDEVLSRGAIFIPAHVDKPIFSIPSQLGFLPDDAYTAIEVFSPANAAEYCEKYAVITASDAHYPDDIAKKYFTADLAEKSYSALKEALKEKKNFIAY